MLSGSQVSEKIKESVEEYLLLHPDAKQIADIEQQIDTKKNEIIELEATLSILQKKRPEINLEYRKSVIWCLSIDSDNPYYFLKSKEGLVRCVEYKHKIKITPKQNNTFGGILSGMFREGLLGRITHFDVFFYGLPDMFEKDKEGNLTILKKKYEEKRPNLRHVNV